MLYAKADNGARLLATPGEHGLCPGCGMPVSARCGEVKIWHWAHDNLSDCPYAPETEWHLKWKSLFPTECVEIINGAHRADVIFNGVVYEFQTVALEPSVMIERQAFWESKGYRFYWVFNFTERYKNFKLQVKDGYSTFRWKWPSRRLEGCPFPYYFDLGNCLFLVKKIYWNGEKIGGWGSILDLDFICKTEDIATPKTP